jgi:hypothetical protein
VEDLALFYLTNPPRLKLKGKLITEGRSKFGKRKDSQNFVTTYFLLEWGLGSFQILKLKQIFEICKLYQK